MTRISRDVTQTLQAGRPHFIFDLVLYFKFGGGE